MKLLKVQAIPGLSSMPLERLMANPMLAVSDLQMALREFKAAGGQDLELLVAYLRKQNLLWKTAPNVLNFCLSTKFYMSSFENALVLYIFI